MGDYGGGALVLSPEKEGKDLNGSHNPNRYSGNGAPIIKNSVRYLLFVIIYVIALQYQKGAEDSYSVQQAMTGLLVDNPFRHPVTGVAMTFHDIRTIPELWAWMELRFIPSYYDWFWSDGNPKEDVFKSSLLNRNRVTNGFRWTQRRGKLNECLTTTKYNSFFPYCFPRLNARGQGPDQDKDSFGPYYATNKYNYTDYGHAGAADDGFVVHFAYDLPETEKKLRELKADRWLDMSTQWARVDFTTYNPSAQMFAQVELSVAVEASGRLVPAVQVTTLRSEVYMNSVRDYIQIVLELLVMVGMVMYIIGDLKDALVNRSDSSWAIYLGQFWNVVDLIQILLFVICFIMWMVIITDPVRKDIKVQLAQDAGEGQRAMLQDVLEYKGTTLTLAATRRLLQSYFATQAITLLITLLRLLKYLTVNPFLGSLVETFVIMKVQVLQFVLVVALTNTAFAYMGYILFGHALYAFHSFDMAYFTCLGMLLGDGVGYGALAGVNGVGAPIFYVPFVIFYAFIILQLVVAIIVEAYQVQQAHRTRRVGLGHQMAYGLMRWIPSLRRYGEDQQRYKNAATTFQIRDWLHEWYHKELEKNPSAKDEYDKEELREKLRDKNVKDEDIAYIFERLMAVHAGLLACCDASVRVVHAGAGPPPPEPEVNDMVRELFKQIKVLSDAHAVAQRKLDTILAGQNM